MKHLYIIGNGFDLHHEMKTSYPHFREWLKANDASVLYTIDELFSYCDEDWWLTYNCARCNRSRIWCHNWWRN